MIYSSFKNVLFQPSKKPDLNAKEDSATTIAGNKVNSKIFYEIGPIFGKKKKKICLCSQSKMFTIS